MALAPPWPRAALRAISRMRAMVRSGSMKSNTYAKYGTRRTRLAVIRIIVIVIETRGSSSVVTAIETHRQSMHATTKKVSTARFVRSRKNISATRGV